MNILFKTVVKPMQLVIVQPNNPNEMNKRLKIN